MQPATGELIEKKVLVTKPKHVGRLYSKSRFGEMTGGNVLQLDLLEAAYLLEEKKIRIFHSEEEIDFEYLVRLATLDDTLFETKYLVFKELRNRGYQVKLLTEHDSFFFSLKKPLENEKDSQTCFIAAFSERDHTSVHHMKKLVENATVHHAESWVAIVDEEGDVTYYGLTLLDLQGEIKQSNLPKVKGILLQNRVLIFDEKNAYRLHEKEFFGKPFEKGLQLSLVEALYLVKNGLLYLYEPSKKVPISGTRFMEMIKVHQPDIYPRFHVFSDLKKRGLLVKTGFKFGTHFRAYSNLPDQTHAEYLIHVVEGDYDTTWAEISRGVRLAHSVNKTFLFAKIDPSVPVEYVKLKRLRP